MFSNLIIPKQGIEIQIFFLNRLCKKWAPPRHVTFKCPPGSGAGTEAETWDIDITVEVISVLFIDKNMAGY